MERTERTERPERAEKKQFVVEVVQRRGLSIALWLHTAADPPVDDWDRACSYLCSAKRDVPLAAFRSLVVSDGGAPNLAQRGQLHVNVFDRAPTKMAALTTSLSNPVKRGVAKAIAWTNPSFIIGPPEDALKALAHIDLTGETGLFDDLLRLEARLKRPSDTLRLVRAALGLR